MEQLNIIRRSFLEPMKQAFRKLHRYLGLTLAAFWLLQTLSGALLVFHRPLDDALIGTSNLPLELSAIDEALNLIKRNSPGTRVIEYFVTGGSANQIDVLVSVKNGHRYVIRIDGHSGEILRQTSWENPRSELGIFRFILLFHKQLLAGEIGHWIIGVSGSILFINLLIGLRLAWPPPNRWKHVLLPGKSKVPSATLFKWHRATGTWFAATGLIMALTGALMVWVPTSYYGNLGPTGLIPDLRKEDVIIPSSEAVRAAKYRFPSASLAVVSMPTKTSPWYAIRVRQPTELRRVFGTTFVYVDARTSEILSFIDASTAPLPIKALTALWPIHTGEWAGIAGRLLTLIIGIGLSTTVMMGLALWWQRRRIFKRKKPIDHDLGSTGLRVPK